MKYSKELKLKYLSLDERYDKLPRKLKKRVIVNYLDREAYLAICKLGKKTNNGSLLAAAFKNTAHIRALKLELNYGKTI